MSRRVWGTYGLLGFALWPVPLLNVLQVESAAVVAFAAYFVAGTAAVVQFRDGKASFGRVLGRQEAALVVPLFLLLVAQLWAPNCTVGQGLLFYLLFPGGTVVVAVAVAYALTGLRPVPTMSTLVGLGLVVSVAGPLYDLGFHPQFYTYNHVFGGVLGPIYDEQLAVRSGLFVFRGLTLLWALGAACLGRWGRGRGDGRLVLGVLAAIAVVYAGAVPLGINTSEGKIQRRLGGHVQTAHFDLYYDSTRHSRRAVEALAADHEAYYVQIRDRLGLSAGEGPDRIQSYLYPNPDVKAQLTGARTTSVSPVWLGAPQVHLLHSRADASLGHELAHAFSRPYGLPGLRASWSPGLVEGWAVALEPPSPHPSSHDLVQMASTTDTTGALPLTAEALANRLTPWGFWTGRGAVSYAAMGSFVQYLLDRYGPERLRQVYAWGNFEAVYGRSLDRLVEGWRRFLEGRPFVARAAHEVVTRQFTRPSLFETDCPHYVPPHRRHLQAARQARRAGDTSRVRQHLDQSLEAAPRYGAAHALRARHRLEQGRAAAVVSQLDTLRTTRRSALLQRVLADALVLEGRTAAARRHYRRARALLPRYAHDGRTRLLLRLLVADRPAVVRILVGPRAAAAQAQELASVAAAPATRAWQALRWIDAHRYARADSAWRQMDRPDGATWSTSERSAVALQWRAWRAEAAHRAGRVAAARAQFQAVAAAVQRHGAQAWARALRAWAKR
ncbi:MAG: hypothetical protein BRD55_08475 [Bacteroidetes bacterium SW_9_63_38]|nr:MAG: hypothetical protein BRD55_08475 [Bacteroidetes bacterium SW_9_63_38]